MTAVANPEDDTTAAGPIWKIGPAQPVAHHNPPKE